MTTPSTDNTHLGQEWITLQSNYEQYEYGSWWIKLAAFALCALGAAAGLSSMLISALLAVLWIQESVLRTGQSRLGTRILDLEKMLREGAHPPGAAFQLHTEWLANRPGVAGLASEYLRNASKPTVAFPYAVLAVIAMIAH